ACVSGARVRGRRAHGMARSARRRSRARVTRPERRAGRTTRSRPRARPRTTTRAPATTAPRPSRDAAIANAKHRDAVHASARCYVRGHREDKLHRLSVTGSRWGRARLADSLLEDPPVDAHERIEVAVRASDRDEPPHRARIERLVERECDGSDAMLDSETAAAKADAAGGCTVNPQ